MSAILKLVQGSPEWHAHRSQSRNASETPVVLGMSPWMTPFQLWEIRTGRKAGPGHAADAARESARARREAGLRGPHGARDGASGPGRGRLLGQPRRHHPRWCPDPGGEVPA